MRQFAIAILLACVIAFAGAVLISAYSGASAWYYLLGLLVMPGVLRHGQPALSGMVDALQERPFEVMNYVKRPLMRMLLLAIVAIGVPIVTSAAIWGGHTELVVAVGVAVTAPIVVMLLEPHLAHRSFFYRRSRPHQREVDRCRRMRAEWRRRTMRMRPRIGQGHYADPRVDDNEPDCQEAP